MKILVMLLGVVATVLITDYKYDKDLHRYDTPPKPIAQVKMPDTIKTQKPRKIIIIIKTTEPEYEYYPQQWSDPRDAPRNQNEVDEDQGFRLE